MGKLESFDSGVDQEVFENPLINKYFVLVNERYSNDTKFVSAGYVESDFQPPKTNDESLYYYCEVFDVDSLPENDYELDTLCHRFLSITTLSYEGFFFEDYTKMYKFLLKKAKEVKEYNDNKKQENSND